MKTYEADLHPDQLAVLNDSEAALGRIHRQTRESFQEWLKVGRGVVMWREVAMQIAQDDDINSHAYRKAIRAIARRFPISPSSTRPSDACRVALGKP